MIDVKLDSDHSVTALTMPRNTHIDVGATADIVGIELGHEGNVIVRSVGPNDYRARHTASLNFLREDAERLFYALANRLKLPAFDEAEWRAIRESIDRDLIAHGPTHADEQSMLMGVSNAIHEAYR